MQPAASSQQNHTHTHTATYMDFSYKGRRRLPNIVHVEWIENCHAQNSHCRGYRLVLCSCSLPLIYTIYIYIYTMYIYTRYLLEYICVCAVYIFSLKRSLMGGLDHWFHERWIATIFFFFSHLHTACMYIYIYLYIIIIRLFRLAGKTHKVKWNKKKKCRFI